MKTLVYVHKVTLLFFLTTLLLSFFHGQAQTVSTVIPEFPGDGEMSFDSQGFLYVNDSGENGMLDGDKVFKVDVDNETFEQFHEGLPIWVVGSIFDPNGNLLVTGWSAGTISSITPDGSSSDEITNGIEGAGSLEIDENGFIYVAEYIPSKIIKANPDGSNPDEFAEGPPIQNPAGLAYDEDSGILYASNWTNGYIVAIDSAGNATEFAEIDRPNVGPIKIINGFIYATSPEYHEIYRIEIANPTNVQLFAGTGEPGNHDGDISVATFDTPTGIATRDGGNTIYISEMFQGTGRLRVIEGVLGTGTLVDTPSLVLSPSPAKDIVHITAPNASFSNATEITIYDLTGAKIVEIIPTITQDNSLTLTVETLSTGMYFLEVVDANSSIQEMLKLIKI